MHLERFLKTADEVGAWEERLRPVLGSWRKNPALATQVLCRLRSARRSRAACILLQAMNSSRIVPNEFHLHSALSACERCSDWSRALWQLGDASSFGISSSTVAFNSTMSACEKSHHWQWSLHLHKEMEQQMISKDTISYSAGISACEKAGRWQQALVLFHEMQKRRVRKDQILYGAAISACEKGEAWECALTLHQQCLDEGIRQDEVIHGACISAFEKGAQWQLALSFLDKVPASRVACCAAISACEKAARWQTALGLLATQTVEAMQTKVDVARSAAISACGKAIAWQSALVLCGQGLHDAIAYNAAISACGDATQWPWALHFFQEMGQKQLQRSQISFNAAVSAVEWPTALEICQMMHYSLIPPDVMTFNSILQSCAVAMTLGRAGDRLGKTVLLWMIDRCKKRIKSRRIQKVPRQWSLAQDVLEQMRQCQPFSWWYRFAAMDRLGTGLFASVSFGGLECSKAECAIWCPPQPMHLSDKLERTLSRIQMKHDEA
ncbi:unnamed protein product [Cladocopium goreaui]|uniref:Pentatricopeptide repeat-containing protein GUN1, chloroplastic (Pentatricopeptide repeat-containing protein At2g31400) (Protein GENOMES UNCOUPLED 1) n=1 Tax=Cladocopium goreaui TaxID=2562237 RepID=A0A9P1BTS8_9DINO|nr:unnamed protein product [Cladocopium goreaui]